MVRGVLPSPSPPLCLKALPPSPTKLIPPHKSLCKRKKEKSGVGLRDVERVDDRLSRRRRFVNRPKCKCSQLPFRQQVVTAARYQKHYIVSSSFSYRQPPIPLRYRKKNSLRRERDVADVFFRTENRAKTESSPHVGALHISPHSVSYFLRFESRSILQFNAK